ncbi:OmpA family protein [Rhodobacterales bacterium HKCCE3408]|nr:OmpA family protein [Rhodobacterales bacterium HKCCE3408]
MIRAALLFGLLAAPAWAQGILELPETAEETLTETERQGSYLIPTAPWDGTGMPAFEAEGNVRREVWRIDDFAGGTGVLLAVLSGQLDDQGFDTIFSCTARICGGFDFRYALDIAPEPEMHVNMADYAFHAARRATPDGPEYVALMVSQGGGSGFVQVVDVVPATAEMSDVTLSTRQPDAPDETPAIEAPAMPATLAGALTEIGRAPLPGVTFDYGATDLADTDLPILAELASYLEDNPGIRLTLVGHTDAEGGLAGNIAVSRARAQSVRRALIDDYGISGDRLSAEGIGYLMPLAPNTTEEGRDINRRVEAVVINTE